MSEKGRKALKNNLLVGILYEIAGLACLMALMVIVLFNDIRSLL